MEVSSQRTALLGQGSLQKCCVAGPLVSSMAGLRPNPASYSRLNILPVSVLLQGFRPPDRVLDGHWVEIPDIYPDIDAVRAAVPVGMHVAEQMQRTFAGVVPSHHRVMAKRYRAFIPGIIHLCQPRHTFRKRFLPPTFRLSF